MSNSSFPPPVFPPVPPVRADVAEYIKAFKKPLTTDEKAAWLAEIVYRVLHDELPQEVYPALKDKIESLPTVAASKDRPEEILPGSDYVYPGPPKPLKPTTTIFSDAVSVHAYEQRKTVRRRETDSSFFVLVFIGLVMFLGFVAYGIGTWTMNSTKLIRETPQPLEPLVPVANW